MERTRNLRIGNTMMVVVETMCTSSLLEFCDGYCRDVARRVPTGTCDSGRTWCVPTIINCQLSILNKISIFVKKRQWLLITFG